MKIGDIVRQKWLIGKTPTINRQLTGMILKVFHTESGNKEYRVQWFNGAGRSRCTQRVLEVVSEARRSC